MPNIKSGTTVAAMETAPSGGRPLHDPESGFPTRQSRSGMHATHTITFRSRLTTRAQLRPLSGIDSHLVNRHKQFRRNYHRANWERFQQVIDSYINYEALLGTSEHIDLQIRSIEQAIFVARKKLVRTARQVSNTLTINILTKDLIRLRNVTRSQYCAACA